MKNLEYVKGLVINEDGNIYPFGTQKYDYSDNLTDDNFHDESFRKDIASAEWFRDLKEKKGFEYIDDTIHRQCVNLAKYGLVTFLNASVLTAAGEEYNAYCVFVPSELSEIQKELFRENYDDLKELIERKKAYFEAKAYDNLSNEVWDDLVFDLDDFYERMKFSKFKHL